MEIFGYFISDNSAFQLAIYFSVQQASSERNCSKKKEFTP